MTTLLSRAAQLTAGRCGSGGERDFVAELLWRTPRRLLCGRAQIGHDIPAAAAAGRRTESRCVRVRPFLVHVVAVHLVCFVCHCTLRCPHAAARRGPCCMWIVCGLWCRIGRRPFAPARTFEVRRTHIHGCTFRQINRIHSSACGEIITISDLSEPDLVSDLDFVATMNLRTHTSTQTQRGHRAPPARSTAQRFAAAPRMHVT